MIADQYYYPATLTQVEGDDIYIRYDTGEEEWTNSDYLAEMKVAVGDEVESKWSQDGEYYTAQVTAINGEQVHVVYEAGRGGVSVYPTAAFPSSRRVLYALSRVAGGGSRRDRH